MSKYVVYQDLKGNRKAVYYSKYLTAKDHWHLINDELIGVIEHYDGEITTLLDPDFATTKNFLVEILRTQSAILVEDLGFDVDKFAKLSTHAYDKWNLVKEFYEDRYTGP